MIRAFFLLVSICLAFTANAAGQDYDSYQQRQKDLAALSSIFGELHHIRRYCEPRYEADVWRDRMKSLIDLEAPLPEAQQAMVAAFNNGYRNAQRRFPSCNRRARDYAASRAVSADAIVERLTAPLYEAMRENEPLLMLSTTPQTGDSEQLDRKNNNIVNER